MAGRWFTRLLASTPPALEHDPGGGHPRTSSPARTVSAPARRTRVVASACARNPNS